MKRFTFAMMALIIAMGMPMVAIAMDHGTHDKEMSKDMDHDMKMDDAKDEYKGAMNKLVEGRGNIIVSIEKLKKMGAKAKKSIPEPILRRAQEDDFSADEPGFEELELLALAGLFELGLHGLESPIHHGERPLAVEPGVRNRRGRFHKCGSRLQYSCASQRQYVSRQS